MKRSITDPGRAERWFDRQFERVDSLVLKLGVTNAVGRALLYTPLIALLILYAVPAAAWNEACESLDDEEWAQKIAEEIRSTRCE